MSNGSNSLPVPERDSTSPPPMMGLRWKIAELRANRFSEGAQRELKRGRIAFYYQDHIEKQNGHQTNTGFRLPNSQPEEGSGNS